MSSVVTKVNLYQCLKQSNNANVVCRHQINQSQCLKQSNNTNVVCRHPNQYISIYETI